MNHPPDSPNVRSDFQQHGRTPRELLRDPSLSCNAKAAYALIEQCAGFEYLTRGKLAGWMGCSDSTAKRAIRELRDAGWITVTAKYLAGEQVGNDYRVHTRPKRVKSPVGHQ